MTLPPRAIAGLSSVAPAFAGMQTDAPRSMLWEELRPINSELWLARLIVKACGFHGTRNASPRVSHGAGAGVGRPNFTARVRLPCNKKLVRQRLAYAKFTGGVARIGLSGAQ